MKWFEDEAFKRELAMAPERVSWAEIEAEQFFPFLLQKLPSELRFKDRIGPLALAEIEGVEGTSCWMVPLDGSNTRGKLLGVNHQVKLMGPQANLLFEGLWGDVPQDLILTHVQFFIWLEPPKRS